MTKWNTLPHITRVNALHVDVNDADATLLQFPRARVFMDELSLEVSPQCDEALKSLRDMADKPLEPLKESQDDRNGKAKDALRLFQEHFGKSLKFCSQAQKFINCFRPCLRNTVLPWWAASEHQIGKSLHFRHRRRQNGRLQNGCGSELLVPVRVGLRQVLQRDTSPREQEGPAELGTVKACLDCEGRRYSSLCQVSRISYLLYVGRT